MAPPVLLTIHSHLRWLIVVLGLLVLIRCLLGWLSRGKFGTLDRILIGSTGGLLGLQFLLGLVMLLWDGFMGMGFPEYRLAHAVILFVAVYTGSMSSRWKKANGRVRFRNTFLAWGATLALIYLGVAVLPGGWMR